MTTTTAQLPTVTLSHYGYLQDGTEVSKAILINTQGVEVEVINYGGIITRFMAPDANGEFADIVLGLDNLADYETKNPFFGALIGRYGNRIAGSQFELDGEVIKLDANDGPNNLHGGFQGFDKKVWGMAPFTTETSCGVVLTLVSPDGDQGFPGEVQMEVIYELTADNAFDMRISGVTDKPTLINMTQHTYFNLAAEGSILDHQMQINAQEVTPGNAQLIPDGSFAAVEGTPFDFRTSKTIGQDIEQDDEQLKFAGGYDHNFVINKANTGEHILAATAVEPKSGRVLEVWTQEPGIQLYSGNFLDGGLQGKGRSFGLRSGFCLEPQHYPNSPNIADFPSTVVRPGETYQTRITYKVKTQ